MCFVHGCVLAAFLLPVQSACCFAGEVGGALGLGSWLG